MSAQISPVESQFCNIFPYTIKVREDRHIAGQSHSLDNQTNIYHSVFQVVITDATCTLEFESKHGAARQGLLNFQLHLACIIYNHYWKNHSLEASGLLRRVNTEDRDSLLEGTGRPPGLMVFTKNSCEVPIFLALCYKPWF